MKAKELALIGILIGISLISLSVPIGDNLDVTCVPVISLPLPSLTDLAPSPQISYIDTCLINPHTLYHLPDIAGMVTSGDLKLTASGGGVTEQKSLGSIWRSTDNKFTITLPNVPPSTTKVTFTLYENNKQISTMEASLT